MVDREVRIGRCTIIAGLLWLSVVGQLAYMVLFGANELRATWCVVTSATAATVTVRCFLVSLSRETRNTLLLRRDLEQDGNVQPIGHHNTC